MQIRGRNISVLIVVCLLSQSVVAKTKQVNDWNNVRILEIGSFIVVKTKRGEHFEGKFEMATVSTLSIAVDVSTAMRRVIDLPKDDVKEVRKRMPRAASAALGTAVGLGAGIGIGAIVDSKDKYHEDPGLGKFVFG